MRRIVLINNIVSPPPQTSTADNTSTETSHTPLIHRHTMPAKKQSSKKGATPQSTAALAPQLDIPHHPVRDDNGEYFSDDPSMGFDCAHDPQALSQYIWQPIATLSTVTANSNKSNGSFSKHEQVVACEIAGRAAIHDAVTAYYNTPVEA